MWTALLRFPREASTAQAKDEVGRASEKVFPIDVLTSPWVAKRTLIAAITEPGVIVRVLDHLGLPSEPPQNSAQLEQHRTHGLVDDVPSFQ